MGSKPVVSVWILALLICIIYAAAYFNALSAEMNSLKTQCDFSNLATYKDISRTELSTKGDITFDEDSLTSALSTFKEYLISNLGTDENLNALNKDSNITNYVIHKLIIYNVVDAKTTEYAYDDSSQTFKTVVTDNTSKITTPTGRTVTKTSVYTDVTYNLLLKFDYKFQGHVTSYTAAVNQ